MVNRPTNNKVNQRSRVFVPLAMMIVLGPALLLLVKFYREETVLSIVYLALFL